MLHGLSHQGDPVHTPRTVGLLLIAAALAGCAGTTDIEGPTAEAAILPPPRQVMRPCEDLAHDLGDMIIVFHPELTRLVLECGPALNVSGSDRAPPNYLAQITQAIDWISSPLCSTTTYADVIGLSGSNALAVPAGTEPYTKREQPHLVIDAKIIGVSERVVLDEQLRGDGLARAGSEQIDFGASADRRRTVTSLACSMIVRSPKNTSIVGTSATFELMLDDRVQGGGASFYVSGTGVGGSTKITTNKDRALALFDIAVAQLVVALGTSLDLPYFQLDPGLHAPDRYAASVRLRLLMSPLATQQDKLKKLLFAAGCAGLDMDEDAVTAGDADVFRAEMIRRGIDPSSPTAAVDTYLALWQGGMDMKAAADRIRQRLAYVAGVLNRRAVEANTEAQRAAAVYTAAYWGFSANTRFIVIDATAIREDARAAALDTLKNTDWCEGVAGCDTPGIYAIAFGPTAGPADAHHRLCTAPQTRNLTFAFSLNRRRLTLAPEGARQ
jgi:hypothetical protein